MCESITVDSSTVLIYMGQCSGARERSGAGTLRGWDI